jgi:YegS/Rv2252/BmrU family lipid kinase
MKHYFILNPKAGKGTLAEELAERIHTTCESAGVEYEIYRTRAVGDATEFVRGVASCANNLPARFYACGGDGTFGEVVNGAALIEGAQVGVIPIGTGNDFVRNFDGGDRFFDISAQIGGDVASIDLIRCNDMYAINMINVGFDCEVVKKTVKLKKSPLIPSKLAYVAGVVTTLVRKPGVSARIFCDGELVGEKKFLLTTFANGAFCGGGFNSNPAAMLCDGRVDALFIDDVSRRTFIGLVGSYKKGTHICPKNEKILLNTKHSKIELEFPSVQSASIDGELFDFERLSVECVPSAVSFIVPCGASFKLGAYKSAVKSADESAFV